MGKVVVKVKGGLSKIMVKEGGWGVFKRKLLLPVKLNRCGKTLGNK